MEIIKKKKRIKKADGFTLVETLVYIALIGGAMISFVNFTISITNSRNKVYVKQEVQANARMALNLISQTIKSADGVNVASSTFATDPGILSLVMGNSIENPTIISLTGNDGLLQIKKGSTTEIPITSDEIRITNLVFTNLTSGSTKENIKIEITLEYAKDESVFYQYSTDLQTSVSLRR